MRIVRTVGQAFEVCHKFNLHKNSLEPNDERSDVSSSELLDVEQISEQQLSEDGGLLPVLASETPKKGECVYGCVCVWITRTFDNLSRSLAAATATASGHK